MGQPFVNCKKLWQSLKSVVVELIHLLINYRVIKKLTCQVKCRERLPTLCNYRKTRINKVWTFSIFMRIQSWRPCNTFCMIRKPEGFHWKPTLNATTHVLNSVGNLALVLYIGDFEKVRLPSKHQKYILLIFYFHFSQLNKRKPLFMWKGNTFGLCGYLSVCLSVCPYVFLSAHAQTFKITTKTKQIKITLRSGVNFTQCQGQTKVTSGSSAILSVTVG